MARMYRITVRNDSGDAQNYAFFNQAPLVTGTMPGQVWPHVFATSPRCPQRGSFSLAINQQYYGLIGTSQGSPSDGVAVDITSEQEVSLGYQSADGFNIPGTSLAMEVQDGVPQISPTPLPNGSDVGAFEVKSGDGFTVREAENGNYAIGFGFWNSFVPHDVLATFVPAPRVDYQIYPSSIYYLTSGDYTQGAIIDPKKIGPSIPVDFTTCDWDAQIVHEPSGNFHLTWVKPPT